MSELEVGGHKYEGQKYEAKYEDVKEYASKLPDKFDKVYKEVSADLNDLDSGFRATKRAKLDLIKFDLNKVTKKIDSEWGIVYNLEDAMKDLEALQKVEKDMLFLLDNVRAEKLKVNIREEVETENGIVKEGIEEDINAGDYIELGKEQIKELVSMSRTDFRKKFLDEKWGEHVLKQESDEVFVVNFMRILDFDLHSKVEKDIGLFEIAGEEIDQFIQNPEESLVIVDHKGNEKIVTSRDGRRVLDEKGNYIPVWSGYKLKIVKTGASSSQEVIPNS